MAARVGVAWPGDPRQAQAWSGTTAGLIDGLERAGVEVVVIDVEPPSAIRYCALSVLACAHVRRVRPFGRAQAVAGIGDAMAGLRTALARARARRAEPFDGVIQIGTGYLLPPGLRTVTFEDMTVPLAAGSGYRLWQLLPQRALRRRMARQATAYRRARACCAATPWAARSMRAEYGIAAEKVHVVGVGRNQDLAPSERDWSKPRFLFVGLDWERKQGALVVRAFERLRASIPDARLDLVGGHPAIRSPGVTGHGTLRLDDREGRERLAALFSQATCFVMPSRVEPVGIVYAEAAAAGLPSIGSRCGGAPFVIGAGGLTVEPGNEEALVEAMLDLSDAETAARLGALAHARSRLFTWRAVAERLLRALAPAGVSSEDLAPFL